MRVYHSPAHQENFRPVSSPGDLAGLTGRIRVVREDHDTDRQLSAWVPALGAFVVRGGKVD